MEDLPKDFILYVAIPWCAWVTMSLFNQRQEIAVLKEILKALKKMIGPSTDP
jgi:hypothetical protein